MEMNNKLSKTFTFIDLFAGIGGIKIGLKSAGFKCVFSNDFDKYCKITYDLNRTSDEPSLHLEDIAKVSSKQLPEFDILAAGFPCQPFSIAGYRKGFKDKGRGDLFFEIIRFLKEKRPSAFLLENVKNLKTHNNGSTLEIIHDSLEKADYFVASEVLNSMEYGNIPQNRERIYIVGFRDELQFNKFSFPTKITLTKSFKDCLENEIDFKYYYNNKPLYRFLEKEVTKKDTAYQWRRKYVRENKSNVCPTLTANMGTGGHNVPIILDKKGIRKLSPRECANFQGFPKDYRIPNLADSNLYKQFGNSVTIPVVSRIAKRIKKALE